MLCPPSFASPVNPGHHTLPTSLCNLLRPGGLLAERRSQRSKHAQTVLGMVACLAFVVLARSRSQCEC